MTIAARPAEPTSKGCGTVHGAPRLWLRLEGLTLLVGTLGAYLATGQSWWLVAIVVLLPDLFMVGYLGGTRVGAVLYNVAHATSVPAVLVWVGWWQQRSSLLAIGLVWLAHIGLDRLMGYGLKYDDHFQHTHLGWIGRRPQPDL
ncbi:MAG: DUF4260 domain-containing protein [Ilumatobacteraceae bacterium]|nr:DUF4260 domain-containing protein [Ilumatobacteraceae bacterium]